MPRFQPIVVNDSQHITQSRLRGVAIFAIRIDAKGTAGISGIEVGQLVPNANLRLTDLDGQQLRTIPCNAEATLNGAVIQTNSGLRILEWGNKGLRLAGETEASRFHLGFLIHKTQSV